MTEVLVGASRADTRTTLCLTPLAGVLLAVKSGVAQLLGWLLTRPEYSYGVIIPVVAGFLVWERRDQIMRLPFTGSWTGLLLAPIGAAAATTLRPYIPD